MTIVDAVATLHNELCEEQQRIDALWARLNALRGETAHNHQRETQVDQAAVSLDFASHWDNFATAFVHVFTVKAMRSQRGFV